MGGWKAALHRRMATGGVCCGKDLHKPQRQNQKSGPGALALHPESDRSGKALQYQEDAPHAHGGTSMRPEAFGPQANA